MKEEKSRYIDVYRGLGIVLVILGNLELMPENYKIWINAFGMLLFLVAEGALIGEKRLYERSGSKIFCLEAKRFLLPYFWISLLVVFTECVVMLFSPLQVGGVEIMEQIMEVFSLYVGTLLWFLPVMFISVTGYQLLRKKIDYIVLLVLSAILAAVICGINGIPVYLVGKKMSLEVFLLQMVYTVWRGCVGIFFCAVGEGMSMLIRRFEKKKLLLVLLGIGLTFSGSWFAICNGKKISIPISFRYLITGEMVLFFGAAVFLCCGLLLICRWIDECSPLEFFGKYFLIILATCQDCKVVELAEWSGDRIFALLDHDFIRNVTVLAVVFGVEIALILLMQLGDRVRNHLNKTRSIFRW
ncbi:MAG: hypothetical protein ACI4DW_03730 [Lachnospiraceae bacterium]